MSGIDCELLKPHSTRLAAFTAAYRANFPLVEILKRAGWSNADTFRGFMFLFELLFKLIV